MDMLPIRRTCGSKEFGDCPHRPGWMLDIARNIRSCRLLSSCSRFVTLFLLAGIGRDIF